MEVEEWLNDQSIGNEPEDEKPSTSEDYFKSIVKNVQGYIEQRSKEDIDRVRKVFGYDDSAEVQRLIDEREKLQKEKDIAK